MAGDNAGFNGGIFGGAGVVRGGRAGLAELDLVAVVGVDGLGEIGFGRGIGFCDDVVSGFAGDELRVLILANFSANSFVTPS